MAKSEQAAIVNRDVIVRMEGISKRYPGVQALENVDFAVSRGEIRALIGENGAGKSTLIRLLTGAEAPTAGRISVDGETMSHMTPARAERLGIGCVYQNLILAEHLTVAENVWMGRLPSRLGFVGKRLLLQKTADILSRIGYADVIQPAARVKDLSASQQSMVAIVRAICREARVMIFDEPTAMLADREVDELLRVIRWLQEQQLAIIYISHRLEEIFQISDSVSVLKDGRHVGVVKTSQTSQSDLIAMMVGRKLTGSHFDQERTKGPVLLQVEAVTNAHVSDCSLTLQSGEIVGIYGLVGAGRTELSRALIGRDPLSSGSIAVRGETVPIASPRQAIDLGISLVPEDRRRHGLALQLSVAHNLNLPVYRKHQRLGFIHTSQERTISDRFVRELAIRTPTIWQSAKNLSGGNQQKVVVGKWLASGSRIFIMDEPTNGVDVGAKEEIYRIINRLARTGAGILFISSYMPELINICDRILVMNSGRIVADVQRSQFDEKTLLTLAIES